MWSDNLLRCVTNEGVLTFRCFPAKSQLKNRRVSTVRENKATFGPAFGNRFSSVIENIYWRQAAAVNVEPSLQGLDSGEKTKGVIVVSFRAQREK